MLCVVCNANMFVDGIYEKCETEDHSYYDSTDGRDRFIHFKLDNKFYGIDWDYENNTTLISLNDHNAATLIWIKIAHILKLNSDGKNYKECLLYKINNILMLK